MRSPVLPYRDPAGSPEGFHRAGSEAGSDRGDVAKWNERAFELVRIDNASIIIYFFNV